MRDNSNGDIWATIAKDPELQRAILDGLRESEKKYTIPTTNISKFVDLAPDEETRENWKRYIEFLSGLKLGSIATAQNILRQEMKQAEAQGAAVTDPLKKMLSDIDLYALASFMFMSVTNRLGDKTREAGENDN